MRVEQSERKKGELNLPLLYFLVLGLCAAAAFTLHTLNKVPHFTCVFKAVTGVPCPTCGSTRVARNLFELKAGAAFLANPMVFIIGIGFVAWFIYGFYMLLTKKKVKITPTKKEIRLLKWIVLIAVFLNWIYLILAGI